MAKIKKEKFFQLILKKFNKELTGYNMEYIYNEFYKFLKKLNVGSTLPEPKGRMEKEYLKLNKEIYTFLFHQAYGHNMEEQLKKEKLYIYFLDYETKNYSK